MKPEEILGIVLDRLEAGNIPYMIVGSFASNLYGLVRSTLDADVVVQTTTRESIHRFADSFAGDFFTDASTAVDALRHSSMFNIIHVPTAFKVDVIFSRRRDYDRAAFDRRMQKPFHGGMRWFCSPEDAILSKLEWLRESESARQMEDAVGIAKVQGAMLNIEYLQRWAKNVGVDDLLNKVLAAIDR